MSNDESRTWLSTVGPLREKVPRHHDQHEFGEWSTVLGDDKLAAAMIDRVVHHRNVLCGRTDGQRGQHQPVPVARKPKDGETREDG